MTARGEVTIFNLAARRTLGVPRVRTLAGLARRVPEAAEALRQLPAGERALVKLEGGDGPQELVAYATRFTVGGEAHTLVSLQDIREELEARELEAWQELSRVLAHEIANSVAPIASLAGTARQLVGDGGAGDRLGDVHEALGTIERRSRGLVSFVDAYRTLARLPRPRPRVVSAAELLGDVATLARASAPSVVVAVEVDPPGLELVADADLVEQALVNLALNAVEALGERGGHVTLRARAGASGRGEVAVEDDGPGLLPEVRERAFVPFFSTKPGGAGWGSRSPTGSPGSTAGRSPSSRSPTSGRCSRSDCDGVASARPSAGHGGPAVDHPTARRSSAGRWWRTGHVDPRSRSRVCPRRRSLPPPPLVRAVRRRSRRRVGRGPPSVAPPAGPPGRRAHVGRRG